MTDTTYVPLPGSERAALPQAAAAGSTDDGERIEVTVITRRRAELPREPGGALARVSHAELRDSFGSDPAEQDLVAQVLAGSQVTVTGQDPATRRVTLSGPASALAATFGTSLSVVTVTAPDGTAHTHRYREGGLKIPAQLDGIVMAVLGLDNRPQAEPRTRRPAAHPDAAAGARPVSYTPPQVAAAYQFPAGTDGTGQHVAILEFGGGFAMSDLEAYFGSLGVRTPSVTAVPVAGGQNVAGQDPQGADGEVLLDIEVVGAVAPGAVQSVYFAPNTDRGFVEAVTAAAHATPAPAAISISWGQSEDQWTGQARTSLDSAIADAVALGITVTVASGDNGSADGQKGRTAHCDFPASSPHALGCGGTSLRLAADGSVSSESVWNDGAGGGACGGGISDHFGLPAWQADAGVPVSPRTHKAGRGVPDVSGNSDPETGYQVRIDGQTQVIGGTSAVAPLWAALTCRLAQAAGKSFGLLQETLYAGARPGQPAPGLRDITSGNNGAYAAAPGWDPCSGLGVPEGTALLGLVSQPSTEGPAVPAG
jgi:kumamolisin